MIKANPPGRPNFRAVPPVRFLTPRQRGKSKQLELLPSSRPWDIHRLASRQPEHLASQPVTRTPDQFQGEHVGRPTGAIKTFFHQLFVVCLPPRKAI